MHDMLALSFCQYRIYVLYVGVCGEYDSNQADFFVGLKFNGSKTYTKHLF